MFYPLFPTPSYNLTILINQLMKKFEFDGIQALSDSSHDTDSLIVQTAIKDAFNNPTVVVVGHNADNPILIIAPCNPDKDIRVLRDGQGNVKE